MIRSRRPLVPPTRHPRLLKAEVLSWTFQAWAPSLGFVPDTTSACRPGGLVTLYLAAEAQVRGHMCWSSGTSEFRKVSRPRGACSVTLAARSVRSLRVRAIQDT